MKEHHEMTYLYKQDLDWKVQTVYLSRVHRKALAGLVEAGLACSFSEALRHALLRGVKAILDEKEVTENRLIKTIDDKTLVINGRQVKIIGRGDDAIHHHDD